MKTSFHARFSLFAACNDIIMALPILLRPRLNSFDPVLAKIPSTNLARRRNANGFTLVELLVVMGIMAIMLGIAIVNLPGLKGANDINKAAADIAGVFDLARTQAMAGSTYTWVGIFEEDPTIAATTPQTAGTGQLVMAVVASADGTNLNGQAVLNSYNLSKITFPSGSGGGTVSGVTQITRLLKVPNIHLADIPAASTIARPPWTYQILDPTLNSGTTTFGFPVSATATPQYTFKQIIQFNPQGDASVIYGTPTQIIEIGLQPARGNKAIVAGNGKLNVLAIQIEGIGGKVTTYRP